MKMCFLNLFGIECSECCACKLERSDKDEDA